MNNSAHLIFEDEDEDEKDNKENNILMELLKELINKQKQLDDKLNVLICLKYGE